MRSRFRTLWIGAFALVLALPGVLLAGAQPAGVTSSSGVAAIVPPGTVIRLGGANRFATAAAISAATFAPGVPVAYIAYASNFPDALAGAAAAGTLPGPVLLAATNLPINAATTAELTRLKPHQIIVLGGTGVISDAVKTALAAYAVGGDVSAPPGVPGPAGPAGPAGATGATGPAGPAGISGYEVVTDTTAFDATTYKELTVPCPPGKTLIGGGAGTFWPGIERPQLVSSFMLSGGWYGDAQYDGSTPEAWYLEVQAICAIVAP